MYFLTDALKMVSDIKTKGIVIYLWGGLLNIPQVVGGLIFIRTVEGLVILLTVLFTLAVAGQIHKRKPFSRGIGICHLPWLVMLPWLLWRIISVEHSPVQSYWMIYVAIVVSVSLIFDVNDVIRYARGSKTFAWSDRS